MSAGHLAEDVTFWWLVLRQRAASVVISRADRGYLKML
jgi:hypothetical protein